MHGTRSTPILLVVFLALGAYVYFVELERPPASESPPNEQLFEWEADAITGLALNSNGEATELSRTADGDGWQITAPISAAADETQISSITSALESLEVPRVINDAASDLTPFGLVEPEVEVAISVSGDPQESRLLIGDATPTGGERYAKLAASNRVFLVASYLNTTLGRSTFDLRDKTILNFENGDVEQFEIGADRSMRFTKDQNEWRMVEPWSVRADFSTVEGTVGRLSSGQMRSIATEGPVGSEPEEDPLAMYGLTEPRLTATVRLGSASATLLVGDATADGTYYAKDSSRPVVFTVDSTLVNDLGRDSGEYRTKDLFDFRPFNATRVEIERTDGTTVFEKSDADSDDAEESWMRVGSGSAAVDRSKMDDFLSELSGLRADSFVESRDDEDLGADDVLATIRVRFGTTTSQDGDETEEEQITLWRSADATYGVHGDEPGAAVVDAQSVDGAFEALEALEAAPVQTQEEDEP